MLAFLEPTTAEAQAIIDGGSIVKWTWLDLLWIVDADTLKRGENPQTALGRLGFVHPMLKLHIGDALLSEVSTLPVGTVIAMLGGSNRPWAEAWGEYHGKIALILVDGGKYIIVTDWTKGKGGTYNTTSTTYWVGSPRKERSPDNQIPTQYSTTADLNVEPMITDPNAIRTDTLRRWESVMKEFRDLWFPENRVGFLADNLLAALLKSDSLTTLPAGMAFQWIPVAGTGGTKGSLSVTRTRREKTWEIRNKGKTKKIPTYTYMTHSRAFHIGADNSCILWGKVDQPTTNGKK